MSNLLTGRSRRFVRPAAWLVAGFLLLLALGVPGVAASPDSGNNGTIKIHDEFEPSPVIQNEPHVDCPFHIHFFFADAHQTGDWWIQEWSPNDKGNTVWTGTYSTDANGEYVTGEITLDAGHYKLFWEGDPNKLVKHKAFWVDNDCVEAAPNPTPTPTPEPGATPTPTPGQAELPNTSTASAALLSSPDTWRGVIAVMVGLLTAAFILSPAFAKMRRRIKR